MLLSCLLLSASCVGAAVDRLYGRKMETVLPEAPDPAVGIRLQLTHVWSNSAWIDNETSPGCNGGYDGGGCDGGGDSTNCGCD